MKNGVRLSQCMIVKNEEKNIRQALSWAKEIAFEQIVVDTGSTDRTAKIAEELGASVYHFRWIDDFAAAKNYAISQAKGERTNCKNASIWKPPGFVGWEKSVHGYTLPAPHQGTGSYSMVSCR